MYIKLFAVFFIVLYFNCKAQAQDAPQVETPLGLIRGFYSTSYKGKKFSAFEGVPYAEPPLGNLRFKEPLIARPWGDVWYANQSRRCIQINKSAGNESTIGEEDCLYLNIYSPSEAPTPNDNFDVVVYIHGGAFITGSGSGSAKPTLLMDKDILLVSVNYRLGVLGFLCAMNDAVSCNNGMKDQVMALRWVQENIRSFGGNPDSVTIAGQSAGGASVHYHYLSPLSKGLFHRGFSLSGTAIDPWAFQPKPVETLMRVASHVGCSNTTTTAIVECLRRSPASSVVISLWALFDYLTFPIAPIAPSLEPENTGAFLLDHPYKLLATGKINDVPWLTSSTSDEGLHFVLSTNLYKDLDTLNDKWDEDIHYILNTNSSAADEDKLIVARQIKEHYFGNTSISSAELGALSKLIADREFIGGFQRASLVQKNVSQSPVYAFIFAYNGGHSCADDYETNLTGVCHGDDQQYIFHLPSEEFDNYEAMADIYLNMFESFIKTDKPEVNGVNWLPISDPEIITYLFILAPDDVSLRRAKDLSDIQFWDSLPLKEYGHEM